ncbi:hypothetical protein Nos7524_4673 [Nostoc sp. PCC 7524]|nr:hypothetical protein Nos7524_4673 [Nostoc sp. PCC 7524]
MDMRYFQYQFPIPRRVQLSLKPNPQPLPYKGRGVKSPVFHLLDASLSATRVVSGKRYLGVQRST